MVRHCLPTMLVLAFISSLVMFCAAQNSTNSTVTNNKEEAQWCDGVAGMCFAINVPSDTATDYYVSMTAPGNIGWASVGIGSKMAGSLMFIIAPDNQNVSLSVRLASGHNQPDVLKNVTATLEEGSGLNNSLLTANIHVTNGMSWNGGSLDITSTSQSFIYGFSPNSPSGGASGNLIQHVVVGTFQLDMTSAIGAGGMPTIASPATSWGWSTTVLAHAVMMGLAFVGALPAGAIIIRFLNEKIKNAAFIHQILQLSSLFIIFIAFCVGLGASRGQQFQFGHQWVGLIVFLGLLIQGALGWYHHRRYVADKPTSRRWFTHAHLWLGRFLIFLALINIGLGMQLYGDGVGAQVGWYLIVIVLLGIYAFFYWRTFYRQNKRLNDAFEPPQFDNSSQDDAPAKNYETYRPVNVAAMSDNDLGTYRSEYYDTMDPGVDEFGRSQTVMAVNRPPTAAPSGGRTYDLTPTPHLQGPYGPTEPLRPVTQSQAQLDPFRDPARPRTGVPYPVSMVSHEDMPDTSAPPYERQYRTREV